MDTQVKVRSYLENLGLSLDAADVYLALFMLGPVSALQVSKRTGQARTQVYRHLETLQDFGLVSAEKLSYGTLFRALPLDNVEGILASRDAENARLRNDLSDVIGALRQLAGGSGTEQVGVQHYYGLAGLKQANWNLTKADKAFYVIEQAHITEHLDETFGRRHRERCIERGIITHDLTNNPTVTRAEIEPFDAKTSLYRYIDPKVLDINFEMYIYNDVVTLLDYDPKHMQAVEIHHPLLNAMMRQIYQALWSMAKPIELK